MGVPETKDKLQRYLTDFLNSVSVDSDGDYHFRHESVEVFAQVRPWGDDETTIHLTAPLVFGVDGSPELFEHIARHADDFLFGHLSLREREGRFDIHFTHVLLGDFLDPAELQAAVSGVAVSGNNLDDELQKRFGGTRFHEDA